MDAVKAYQDEAARKSDFERTELNKEKTGVKLEGVTATDPVNGAEVPIFISDYVLATYGTGAIMAVPAHDSRDWEFAKKFGLPIIEVVKGNTPANLDEAAFTDVATGTLVNSGFLTGLSVEDAKEKMYAWLEENHKGCKKVNFKLRDWVFSRQRYWGELSPWCTAKSAAGSHPRKRAAAAPAGNYRLEPGPDGESPLARHAEWIKTTCRAAAAPLPVKPIPCPSGPVLLGTSCAIWTPTTRMPSPARKPWITGARWTGTTAAWSTLPCICCTAVSGTNSCMISA